MKTKQFQLISLKTKAALKYGILIILFSIGYLFALIDPLDEFIVPKTSTDPVSFQFILAEKIWGLIIPNLIVIVLSPIIWKIMTQLMLNQKWIASYASPEKKYIFFFKKLMGIHPKGKMDYFIEETAPNVDMNNLKTIFQEKIIGAISAGIGITFILSTLLKYIVTIVEPTLKSKDILFLMIMIMQIAPLIISFIVPINWTLNDLGLRFLDSDNLVQDIGEEMSKGIFKQFIGIGGLILGINTCYELAQRNDFSLIENVWITLVYFIIFFVLILSGSIILISIIYLTQFHETMVNSYRWKFTQYIPFAQITLNTQKRDIRDDADEIQKSYKLNRKGFWLIIGSIGFLILLYCYYVVLVREGIFNIPFLPK